MKLTVLMDNNTYIDRYYLGEPAVSYLIEADGRRILFDAGYSEAFLRNADAMGLELSAITDLALSHGHNDHTRGLRFLAERYDLSGVRLVAHPRCFDPKTLDGEDIGAPFSRADMETLCRCEWSAKPFALSERCVFLGEIPASNGFEPRPRIGTVLADGKTEDDRVTEDSALALSTKRGVFVVTGCSHSGVCNIVEAAKRVCGCEKIFGVLGGFHLFDADGRLQKTAAYLARNVTGPIYPCHCVSLAAKAKLLETLDVREVGVGLTLSL